MLRTRRPAVPFFTVMRDITDGLADDEFRRRFALIVPHVRRANVFSDGINAWLETVADKYVGTTGYAPREGDVVIDIGAGIGEFTLWCTGSGAKVIAFEQGSGAAPVGVGPHIREHT